MQTPSPESVYFALLESGASVRMEEFSRMRMYASCWDPRIGVLEDKVYEITGPALVIRASQDWYRHYKKLIRWVSECRLEIEYICMGIRCQTCGAEDRSYGATPYEPRNCRLCRGKEAGLMIGARPSIQP